MAQKLFKTGTFAKLCNTTKDTLFHYDHIGILKPVLVKTNGYRYYTLNQVYLFDLIVTLKEVGLSLEEIHAYIKRRNTENFVTMLKEKDAQLHQEIKTLTRRRKLLQNTLKLTEISFDAEENKILFKDYEEMYFILSEKITNNDDKNTFEILSNYFEYVYKNNYYDDFIIGEIVPEESIIKETFNVTYLTSQINHAVRSKYLHIRPAGTYAIKYIRNSYDNLKQEYKKFCCELSSSNIKTTGPIYQNDITSYLSERDNTDYLMLLARKVSK